jgi:hypothetical protein
MVRPSYRLKVVAARGGTTKKPTKKMPTALRDNSLLWCDPCITTRQSMTARFSGSGPSGGTASRAWLLAPDGSSCRNAAAGLAVEVVRGALEHAAEIGLVLLPADDLFHTLDARRV